MTTQKEIKSIERKMRKTAKQERVPGGGARAPSDVGGTLSRSSLVVMVTGSRGRSPGILIYAGWEQTLGYIHPQSGLEYWRAKELGKFALSLIGGCTDLKIEFAKLTAQSRFSSHEMKVGESFFHPLVIFFCRPHLVVVTRFQILLHKMCVLYIY